MEPNASCRIACRTANVQPVTWEGVAGRAQAAWAMYPASEANAKRALETSKHPAYLEKSAVTVTLSALRKKKNAYTHFVGSVYPTTAERLKDLGLIRRFSVWPILTVVHTAATGLSVSRFSLQMENVYLA